MKSGCASLHSVLLSVISQGRWFAGFIPSALCMFCPIIEPLRDSSTHDRQLVNACAIGGGQLCFAVVCEEQELTGGIIPDGMKYDLPSSSCEFS